MEERDIVIVGGGISGLATALALDRKGMRSVVLERSESLRATGATITMQPNGWVVLDYLGVGCDLRQDTLFLQGVRHIDLDDGTETESLLRKSVNDGGIREIKRIQLIEALAKGLPDGMVRFGCHVMSVKKDPLTSLPLIHLHNGAVLKAKVLIGCDGVNSVVLDFLGSGPMRLSDISATRGLTQYQRDHGFDNCLTSTTRDKVSLVVAPVTSTLLYWASLRPWTSYDAETSKDQKLIKRSTLESMKDFPQHLVNVVKECDISTLSNLRMRYHAPWDLVIKKFREGTVTVAGDALHAMFPVIGQGGGASLEDAVVLSRCLAKKLSRGGNNHISSVGKREIEEALAEYIKERRMRLLGLSAQSYLVNKLRETSSSLVKILCVVTLFVFFRETLGHTRYDCVNVNH